MVTFSIRMAGEQAIDSTLDRLTERAQNLTPIWPEVKTRLHEIISDAFEHEGGSTAAGRWAPLSAKYAVWKARNFPGKPILERTGRLRASITGGPEETVVMAPHRLLLQSQVPYGGFHQMGTAVMPRRAPIGLTSEQGRQIVFIISRWMRKDLFKGLRPGEERIFS